MKPTDGFTDVVSQSACQQISRCAVAPSCESGAKQFATLVAGYMRQKIGFKSKRAEVGSRTKRKINARNFGDRCCDVLGHRRLRGSAPRLAGLFSVAASEAKSRRATKPSYRSHEVRVNAGYQMDAMSVSLFGVTPIECASGPCDAAAKPH